MENDGYITSTEPNPSALSDDETMFFKQYSPYLSFI